jgi:sugar phosphate isomerase/epimerase
VQYGVRAAVEPIRAAETSFIHTFAEAKEYIVAVNHPGVRHINGDVYHMLVGETHIGQAIVDAGEMLTNLHMADTNRCALGEGFLDLDTIIMALYLIGYNNDRCFVSPEPLGPGGDPYPAMNGKPNADKLDKLVRDTVRYFREREQAVLEG